MRFPSNRLVLVGELATVVLFIMGGCLAIDTVASLIGYHTTLFCGGIDLAVAVTGSVGVLLTMLGIFIWAATMFRSETGLGLAIGGVLLATLPQMLPHYLSVSCL